MADEANPMVGEHSPSAAPGGRASWLVCRAGTHLCALPLAHVIETMRLLPIEAVPGMPIYVRGLSIIRGGAVPVVDAGLLVGHQRTEAGRLVTIRADNRTIALAVDGVLGIRGIGAEVLSGLPPLLRDAASETIIGIGALDAEFLFFLRSTVRVPDELFDQLTPEGAAS